MTARSRKAAVPPLPPGEGRGEGAPLEVREGPATPYLAKSQQSRHSREGGNPVLLVSLTEVATMNPRGFDERPNDDDLVSFIPMKAVEEESGRLSAAATKHWGDVKKGYTPFQDGDVIFAKITPCMENGKFALAAGLHGGRAAGSTEFHVFRPKPELDSKYLLYFLFTPELRTRARMNMKGAAGQLRVPTQLFNDVRIPLPPLDEQHRIVAELETQLTRLDASVTALKRVQANLKRYRASVLKAACEGCLVPTEADLALAEGRTFESGSELLNRILDKRRACWQARGRYKDATVPNLPVSKPLPAGWTWASVDQLVANVTDGDHQPPPQTEDGIPFLVIGNVRTGRIDLSDTRFVGVAYYESLDLLRRPQRGDLLYTLVGSYGIPVVIKTNEKFCIQRHMAILRPHEISPMSYLAIAMSAGLVFRQATAIATGTAQKTVPLAGLRRIAIPLPPEAEQQRIVAEVERRLSVTEELEATVAANLKRAERLRQSVLAQSFSQV